MHYTLNICPYFIVKLLMAVKVLFKVKIGGGGDLKIMLTKEKVVV